jgi:anti-sigma B factor antagonist
MSSSSSSLTIGLRPDRDSVVVAAGGELDLATSDVLRDALQELRDSGWRNFALDLRDVTFMDSAGVHAVVELLDAARRDGGEGAVVRSSPDVDRLFALVDLAALLPFPGRPRAWSPRRREWGRAARKSRLPARR